MKRLCVIFFFSISMLVGAAPSKAQNYYFKGSFVDAQNNPVAFVNIKILSSQLVYQAGNTGEFGISSFQKTDSAVCYLPGYDTIWVVLHQGAFQQLKIMPNAAYAEKLLRESRMSSLVKTTLSGDNQHYTYGPGESYNELVPNQFVEAVAYPFTGFVPNNNHASYSNIRRFITQRSRVPANAVRLEELWNYFPLQLTDTPYDGSTFNSANWLSECPWNPGHWLLMVNAVARKVDISQLPPANLVFLIDNSGSMEDENKLPLVKAGFKMLAANLRPFDRVAIITYGGTAAIILPPTYGTEKQKMIDVLDSLVAGGSTPGSNGLKLAYELVTTNSFSNGINKVILATDGDFNLGVVDDNELERMVSAYRSTGVTLSCLGVGMGNYKDSKIEVLARAGNGNFAYLDTEEEAEKVMVMELTENLYEVASDVTVHFQFNPDVVKSYRLVGYDNRRTALAAGHYELVGNAIGSGQSVVAMVEIEPQNPLPTNNLSLGTWIVQYKNLPGDSVYRNNGYVLESNKVPLNEADSSFKIAAALAWYGMRLRESANMPFNSFKEPEALAQSAISTGNVLGLGLLKVMADTRLIYEEPVTEKKKPKKGKEKSRP